MQVAAGFVQGELERTLLLMSQSANHQADHGDVDDGLAGTWEVLIVLAETALTSKPAERALDNPPSWKHLEPFHVVGAFDDLHPQAIARPQVAQPIEELARVAAVGPNQAQAREGVAECRHDQACAVAVLNVGRMDNGDQHQPEDIYQQMALAPIDLLARIVAVRAPLSVVLTDWLSMIAALGCRLRPAASRTSPRSSSWIRFQVPSRRQHRK